MRPHHIMDTSGGGGTTVPKGFIANTHRILGSGTISINGRDEHLTLRTLSAESDADMQAAERLDLVVQGGITAENAKKFAEVARYNLDVEAMGGITKIDSANFMPKDAEWYRDFISQGNAVYGLFDSQNLLVSKSGLVLNAPDIRKFGVSGTSSVYQAWNDQFTASRGATLATVLATHPGFQGHGLQKQVLIESFRDVRKGNKTVAFELVTPTNFGSLKATMRGAGFKVIDFDIHEKTNNPYFYLKANLDELDEDHAIHATLDDEALNRLNGTVERVREKIKNGEPRVAISIDIPTAHTRTPWKSPNIALLVDAFQLGYKGTAIKTHQTKTHEGTDERINYMILDHPAPPGQ